MDIFTNHSLRRSGATRLFQANVDRKLVKEATGHSSDAVDAYQVTSDQQRQRLSKVIAGVPSLPSNNDHEQNQQNTEDLVVAMNNVSIQCDERSFKPDLSVNGGIVELCSCKRQLSDLVNSIIF